MVTVETIGNIFDTPYMMEQPLAVEIRGEDAETFEQRRQTHNPTSRDLDNEKLQCTELEKFVTELEQSSFDSATVSEDVCVCHPKHKIRISG